MIQLPAKQLAKNCYKQMFGETKASSSVDLPAGTKNASGEVDGELAEGCYEEMYLNCNEIQNPGNLPADELKKACYKGMYKGCEGVKTFPQIKASELAEDCYNEMFSGCKNLEGNSDSIVLPIDPEHGDPMGEAIDGKLPNGAYNSMFEGCVKIEGVTCAARYPKSGADNMFGPKTGDTSIQTIGKMMSVEDWDVPDDKWNTIVPAKWEVIPPRYLKFTAVTDCTVHVVPSTVATIEYSVDDGITWLETTGSGDTIELAPRGSGSDKPFRVKFRGVLTGNQSPINYTHFEFTGLVRGSGSTMCLLNRDPEQLVVDKEYAFYKMFSGCNTLTTAPACHAEELAPHCCERMFENCTGLTAAPFLGALTLVKDCYVSTFEGCSNITSATLMAESSLAPDESESWAQDMFKGCGTNGVLHVRAAEFATNWFPAIPDTWTTDPEPNELCFKALSPIGIEMESEVATTAEWIKPGTMWTTGHVDVDTDKKVYFRGVARQSSEDHFVITGNAEMSGSIMSMYNHDPLATIIDVRQAFAYLFKGCTTLTGMCTFPATTLAPYCYQHMFEGCTSLTDAPELPATNISESAYQSMFVGCTSITESHFPELENVGRFAMNDMFYGCTALTTISPITVTGSIDTSGFEETYMCSGVTEVPDINIASAGYNAFRNTFKECASLTTIGDINVETLGECALANTFYSCTALTTAGNITVSGDAGIDAFRYAFCNTSALNTVGDINISGKMLGGALGHMFENSGIVTIGDITSNGVEGGAQFVNMFKNCPNLTTVGDIDLTSIAADTCNGMFQDCTSLSDLSNIHIGAVTGPRACKNMFMGCTALTETPDLQFGQLYDDACESMFEGCTALTKISGLQTLTLAPSCYKNMFKGCTSLVNFWDHDATEERPHDLPDKLPATTAPKEAYYGMFEGCENLDTPPEIMAVNVGVDTMARMFAGCVKLMEARVHTVNTSIALDDMFLDVHTSGICHTESRDMSTAWETWIPEEWTLDPEPASVLLFTAGDEVSTLKYVPSSVSTASYSIKISDTEWSDWQTADNITITLQPGQTARYRGTISGDQSETDFAHFEATGGVVASGHISAMVKADGSSKVCPGKNSFMGYFSGQPIASSVLLDLTSLGEGAYYGMFAGNTKVTAATKIAATTLAPSCCAYMYSECPNLTKISMDFTAYSVVPEEAFGSMFEGCESLVKAPQITVAVAGEYAFKSMFDGCKSLVEVPDPIIPVVKPYACSYMFSDCKALATPPSLASVTMVEDNGMLCMFSGAGVVTPPDMTNITSVGVEGMKWMFYGCENLTSTPAFSAMTLSESSYEAMFKSCGALTTVAPLPATTVPASCYKEMFNYCPSLTTAGSIAATTLGEHACEYMYRECAALTTPPTTLPATTLAPSCYLGMFYKCTGLLSAPTLPATNIAESCYEYMFYDCEALTTAPGLSAMNLADRCYLGMFQKCKALVNPPSLPATTIIPRCYQWMFADCTSLTHIEIDAEEVPEYSNIEQMFQGVSTDASTFGGVHKIGEATDVKSVVYKAWHEIIPISWTIVDAMYFTGSGTVGLSKSYGAVYYSADKGKTWSAFSGSNKVGVPSGGKLYVKGSPDKIYTTSAYNQFATTGSLSVGGNVLSMFGLDDHNYLVREDVPEYGLLNLLSGSTVTNAANLEFPVKIAKGGCKTMFYNTPLTTPPTLPSTNLGNECYASMFQSCTSLVNPPALPATTLAQDCYSGMFKSCTKLASTPALPATTLATSCYYSMFEGCTALTTAPTLSATTLASSCYYAMLKGCTKLTSAPTLSVTTLASSCYYSMFEGCTALTTAPTLSATTLASNCYGYMFKGCTALKTAPDLPATSLATSCYAHMFEGCTKIDHVSLNATSPGTNCTDMFKGISTTTPSGNKGGIHKINESTSSLSAIYEAWFDVIPYSWVLIDAMYFTGSGTVGFKKSVGTNYYSTDEGATWTAFSGTNKVSIPSGKKLYVKGTASQSYSASVYNQFDMTGSPSVGGNVMSMFGLNSSNKPTTTSAPSYGCANLFNVCAALTSAAALKCPTSVGTFCCQNMFRGCSALTSAPKLPATSLTANCYSYMFSNCTALTTAPDLPATTLNTSCYRCMFQGCTALKTAPATLPATSLKDECYALMFSGCSALTSAPKLPATTLVSGCYSYMFNGCTKLTAAWIKAAYNSTNCDSMFASVNTSGTLHVPSSISSWGGKPSSWTLSKDY